MLTRFSRTELLLGKESTKILENKAVAVFGVGGVGCGAVETLARSGVGTIAVIDSDKFSLTNLNRQFFATNNNIGKLKVDAAEERIKEINPKIKVIKHALFYLPENSSKFNISKYDYIIDAIDTVSAKIELVMQCKKEGVKIISSMGAGNKLDGTRFEIADIFSTSVCPLAKVLRHELRKRGIEGLKVVYSKEEPLTPKESEEKILGKRQIAGSVPFVPPIAGIVLAGEVIKDLICTGAT